MTLKNHQIRWFGQLNRKVAVAKKGHQETGVCLWLENLISANFSSFSMQICVKAVNCLEGSLFFLHSNIYNVKKGHCLEN